MKEKAYLVKNLRDLNLLPKDASRLYIGSEYCVKAYPKQFKYLLNKIRTLGMPFSLLTPPVIESELPLFFKILEIFEEVATNSSEVIFNDWGVLNFINKNKTKQYKIRTGRFLSYQKRGTQRLYNMIKYEELSHVPILDKKTVDFLVKMGITGIDIDIPIYNVYIKNKPEIHLSIYIPYALNSYTINCPFTFDGKKWGRTCKRECLHIKLIYENQETEAPFFQKGKAFYTKSHPLTLSHVDRIVAFEWGK